MCSREVRVNKRTGCEEEIRRNKGKICRGSDGK